MYIKLLSVVDDRQQAWKHSRKIQDDGSINMEELEKVNFSLHSLKRYTFEVETARIMLDLIVNFTKNIWSQSSRILPIPDLVIDWQGTSEAPTMILNQLKKRADSEPQDLIRLGSPIFTRIGYCFSMDHRTLIGFLKSLRRFRPELYSFYGLEILKAIGMTESELTESTFGELVPENLSLEDFKTTSPQEGLRYIEGVGCDSYNYISQLNRHADVYILSSLWVLPLDTLLNMIMSDHVNYHYIMGKHVYRSAILSHRACWIADWNHWAHRVEAEYTEDDIPNLIPCKCDPTKCQYKADLKARINGTDPNLPCPIFCYEYASKYLSEREVTEGENFLTYAYRKLLTSKGIIK